MAKTMSFAEQRQLALEELDTISKRVSKAREELEIESLVAAEGEPSSRLKKKIAGMKAVLDEFISKRREIEKKISNIDEAEASERGQRQYEVLQSFKKRASPQVKKLHQALYASRNSFLELLELMEAEKIALPSLADFIFPPGDPRHPIDDMQLRFAQLSTLNGLSAWIREDAMHSITGPTQPQEAR